MSKQVALAVKTPAPVKLTFPPIASLPLEITSGGRVALTLSGNGPIDADFTQKTALALVFQKFLAGSAGSSIERSLLIDPSRPIAYAGYANRIVRLDYITWPPIETTTETTDLQADWVNRAFLEYA